MAYTRIHSVRTTVNKAAAYICDASKTEGNTLVTSFACSPRTAEYDFRFSLSKTDPVDKVLAHHMIQSFAPGEVSPEEAHRIGIELADRLLKGKYSYIVSTHVNTNACHNHILFCAADNIEHKKFNSCRKTVYDIRRISDEICLEHGLSVIGKETDTTTNRKKQDIFALRQSNDLSTDSVSDSISNAFQNNPAAGKSTWKNLIRKDIDEAVLAAADYTEFLKILGNKGYEIKEGKYLALRPAGKARFMRGSEKVLGKDYTKERIVERIGVKEEFFKKQEQTADQNSPETAIKYVDSATQYTSLASEYSNSVINPTILKKQMTAEELLHKTQKRQNPDLRFSAQSNSSAKNGSVFIDTSSEKFRNSTGLTRWADRQNLKTAARLYAENGSIQELDAEISANKKEQAQLHTQIIETDRRIRKLSETIHYVEQYQETKPVHDRYKAAKQKELFFMRHETVIILFDGARMMLEKFGVNGNTADSSELKGRLEEMEKMKQELTSVRKDMINTDNKLVKTRNELLGFFNANTENNTTALAQSEKNKKSAGKQFIRD